MYQFRDLDAGSGGGAAALRPVGFGFAPATSFPRWHRPIPPMPDLVVDLGQRIGSGTWFRGLFTCLALCFAGWSLAPGFEPLPTGVPVALAGAQAEEVRALSIAPLAFGADTGRRMGPGEAARPLTDAPERPTLEISATFGRGDGFVRVLERAGVATAEARQVEALVGAAADVSAISPGTPLAITLGRRPAPTAERPLESLAFRARFDLQVKVQRVNGRLTLDAMPIAVDETPLRIQGVVGSGLYLSARAAGAPAKAVETYLRAIATQIDVGGLAAGDRFDMIVEHRRAATGETQTGKLLFAGLDRASGNGLQLMEWEQGGRTQWFEAGGVGRQTGMLQRPVPGSVSSNFGMRRHPILGFSRMHKGMDFRAGYGTPILAATDGRVVRAGWAGGYGRQVRLVHAAGLSSSYSHMSRIAVEPGQHVRQGQVIGYVGSTGLSTGPHLHYELYRGGVPVNPLSVRFTQRAQLAGTELARFRARLRSLLGVQSGPGG